MDSQNWLPLSEFATKHKVSVSTLRRRIKAEEVRYRFDDGKYFIYDEPILSHREHRPSPMSEMSAVMKEVDVSKYPTDKVEFVNSTQNVAPSSSSLSSASTSLKEAEMAQIDNKRPSQDVINAANKLLAELKMAYTKILHEKEEQITGLKEEVSDLKTLVKVLESQLSRFGENIYLDSEFESESGETSSL